MSEKELKTLSLLGSLCFFKNEQITIPCANPHGNPFNFEAIVKNSARDVDLIKKKVNFIFRFTSFLFYFLSF